MTKKELRGLSRADLLELLIEQSEELNALRERLTAAEEALKNREIALAKAGSIAEASLLLNGVFEAAQAACDQYLENMRMHISQQTDAAAMPAAFRETRRYRSRKYDERPSGIDSGATTEPEWPVEMKESHEEKEEANAQHQRAEGGAEA